MPTEPRDPAEVIERILAEMPSDWTALRMELETIRDDSYRHPPEYKKPTWDKLCTTLSLALAANVRLAPDWQRRISAIVRGEA